MKAIKQDFSKRTLIIVGSISLLFCLSLSILMFTALRYDNSTETLEESVSANDIDLNESFDGFSTPNDQTSDLNVNLEVSDLDSDENKELEHGWIINEYGYTYIYGDSGFQQFNYKQSALQRYVECMNKLSSIIPENTSFYNMLVPISTTFADIPREIYKEDNFFNLSQSSFVATVSAKFNESINNVSIVNDLENAYDNNENVYFRTDSNWTSLGAFKGYLAFCKAADIEALDLESFVPIELGDFLGCFYRSTNSEAMNNNPDQFVCYSLPSDIFADMTLYENDMLYTDYNLCDNHVTIGNKYDFYLGRNAGRYSISTNAEGGRLLILGDSSVAPILPFLASHYKEIEYINPLNYNKSLEDFISNNDFDDVLSMCYTTNAVSGNYIPSLINFSGVNSNE